MKRKKINKWVDLKYVFTSGQFEGRTCKYVCEKSPQYIRWCMQNKTLLFHKEVIDYMLKCDRINKAQANKRWKNFWSNKNQNNYSHKNYFNNENNNNSNSVDVKVISPAAQWDHLPDKQKFGKVLGITGGTITKQSIRELYKKRMLEYHPDKCAVLGEEIRKLAHEMTIRINEANAYFKRVYGI